MIKLPQFLTRALGEDLNKNFFILANALPVIVWTADAKGYVDYFNKRWVEYSGLEINQCTGWQWEVVIHPEDLAKCQALWREALITGEAYELEYRLRGKNNIYRWHLGRGLPVRDHQRNIIKWMGICVDIEDQKQVQNILTNAHNEIEKGIKSRTEDLTKMNQLLTKEITDRKNAIEKLQKDTARLAEIITTQSILAATEFDQRSFINIVVQRVESLTQADGAIVEFVEDEYMVYRATSGTVA